MCHGGPEGSTTAKKVTTTLLPHLHKQGAGMEIPRVPNLRVVVANLTTNSTPPHLIVISQINNDESGPQS